MSVYYKMMRRGGEDVEHEAVQYCARHPWCVPRMSARGNVVVSAKGIELYTFMKTCTAEENIKLVDAMFRVMAQLHKNNCLHLDFHPRNLVLCDVLKHGCTVVTIGTTIYGCYLIDFETVWFPTQTAEYFNDLSDKWNSLSENGLGRMRHFQYTVQECQCYDVYSLATYILAYLSDAKGILSLAPTLKKIAGLCGDALIPGIKTVDADGKEETYYTYLADPKHCNKVATVQSALEMLRDLHQLVDAPVN